MNHILLQLERELSSALRDLDAAQTQLRLVDDSSHWSIHQVVEHLLLTYRSTAASFQSRLAKGTPTRSSVTPRHRATQFVVITLGLMPGRRKAPPEVAPANLTTPLSGDQLIDSVTQTLTDLDIIINQARSTFGTAPCLTHFALGPLGARQWRRFHLSHGRHHIRQIKAIRRAHGI
jgi:hypothetical protein